MAVVPRSSLPAWVLDVPLAHRGLWDAQRPENSLAAFAAARDAGCGVELDVHVTADGVPVVVHDADLRRVAGVAVDVRAQPLAAVREHRLADGSPVPTLAEALGALGDAPVMVEVKNQARRAGAVEPPTAAVLAEHGRRAYVASFHPGSLAWFRDNAPGVLRAQTASLRVPAGLGRAVARVALLRRSEPHLLSWEVAGLGTAPVRTWRSGGGAVVAWTVRDDVGLAAAVAGADNVVFEGIAPPVGPRTA